MKVETLQPLVNWPELAILGVGALVLVAIPLAVTLLVALLLRRGSSRAEFVGACAITLLYGGLCVLALLFTWALIALTMIDFDHQLLPDSITLPLLWLGLLVNSFGVLVPLVDAVWGAALGYLSLWSVYWAFRLLTGKEGMGFGDFKLLAALGAWLGWQALPLVIILSSLVGAVIGVVLIVALGRDRNVPIPFGPYLAAAGWITLLWGDAISGVYLSTVAP